MTEQEERDLFEGHIQKRCSADPCLRRLKSGDYFSEAMGGMMINAQKLREVATNAKALTAEDLIGFPLAATAHITGLARVIESCCDHIDAQAAKIARLKSQVEMLEACAAGDAALTAGQQREIARLREAAKMLADWAEHEAGAEPDLTPGLAEARAALAQEGS